MNSIHDRVQTVTQKYHQVEKQSKKPSRVHKHPASPAGTPRCALARPGARMAVVSWSCPRPCRAKGPAVSQASVAVSQLQCRSPRAHPPAPSAPAPAPARPARSLAQPTASPAPYRGSPASRIAGPSAVSQRPLAISWAGTRARPAPSLSSSIIQHFCIAAPKTSLTKPPQSRYKFCIVTLPVHPTYCNTIFPAFPAFSCNTSSCIAIQFSSSQAAQATIQMLCCNTIFQHSLLLLAIQFQYYNTKFFFFTI